APRGIWRDNWRGRGKILGRGVTSRRAQGMQPFDFTMNSEAPPNEKLWLGVDAQISPPSQSPGRLARAALSPPLPGGCAPPGVVIGVGMQSAGLLVAALIGHLLLAFSVSRSRSFRRSVDLQSEATYHAVLHQHREQCLHEASPSDRKQFEELSALLADA